MASSSSFERTLAVQLRSVGNGLLNAPSSVDELLTLLDNAEDLLANMEQEPSDFLLDALLPLMKGLIAEALFKHSNEDVRVTVASCLSEILRITSPEQPYNDDQMKAIFQLIVEAFSELSQPSTRCYEKALSVLQTIARVKACLLMLDLECEALVVRMCLHFWFITRSNPSAGVYWAVEQIMVDILTESEYISPDLLFPLLASVLKENEKVAPSCWKLGEKLISDCATKLRPILRGAMQSKGTTLDDYSPVVAFICRNESATEHNHISGSPKQGITDSADSKGSLMRPKEGYNLSWLNRESQSKKQPQNRRISVNRSNLTAVATVSSRKRRTALKSKVESVREEAAVVLSDLRHKRLKLPTKGGSNTNRCTLEESGVLAGVLVGRRVKVWWPLDKMFYDGLIQSYNPITKKHKVLYDDGDEETLNLEKEWWDFIEDKLPDEEADNPKPMTSPIILTKQSANDKSSQSIKILNYKQIIKRAGAGARLPEVEAPNFTNQNIGGDESSDDDSNDDNVFEIRARSKDVQLENPSRSTSDNSTPEASPPRVIRVRFSNQNIGGDESSDDDSNDDNVFEIRARSKDVQLENPSRSTSDDSTPEASPPRAIRVQSKDVQLENPRTSTSNESTPEGSPLRYVREKSTDARLQSTSDDSTPEASPPRPWGLWRSRSWHH